MKLFKKLAMLALVVCSFLSLAGLCFESNAEELSESVDFSAQKYNNAQKITNYTGSNFNVIFSKGTGGTDPAYYSSGTAIRVYYGGYFTVSCEKYLITKIELTFGSKDNKNEITTDTGVFENNQWTGNATGDVTFKIGGTNGHRRIKGITIYYVEKDKLTKLQSPEPLLEDNIVSYSAVTEASGYIIGLFNSESDTSPVKSWNTTETSYSIMYTPQGSYVVKVKAIGDGSTTSDSDWSSCSEKYVINKVNEVSIEKFLTMTPETSAPYTYYRLTGVISNITNDEYGNFTLVDKQDSTKSVYVYGMTKTKSAYNDKSFSSLNLQEGNILTLEGYVSKYSNDIQVGLAYYISHSSNSKLSFAALSTNTSMKLSYSSSSSLVNLPNEDTVSCDFSTKGYTENTELAGDNATHTLSNTSGKNVSVTFDKGSASATMKYYVKDSAIRFYVNNTMKFSSDYAIKEINFNCIDGDDFDFQGDTTAGNVDTVNNRITIDDQNTKEVTFKGTKKCKIISISVVIYTGENEETIVTNYTLDSVAIRFGTMIEADLYDQLVASSAKVSFGVAAMKTATLTEAGKTLNDYLTDDRVLFECTPVRVNELGEADENGKYYQFALVIDGLEEKLDLEFTAACYVLIDGEITLMQTATVNSIITAASKYCSASDTSSYKEHLGVLEYIKNLA